MNISRVRRIATNTVGLVVGFAAISIGAGTAAAVGPLDDPLVNSTCSSAQIGRALRAERPDLAAKLDANPQRKAGLQRFFNQSVPQRRAEIQRRMNANPAQVEKMRRWQAAHPQQVQQHRAFTARLANTCHNY